MADNKNKSVLSPEQAAERILQEKASIAGLDAALEVMRKPENIERLNRAIQEVFDKDPAEFFREWIHPRLPKLSDEVGEVEFAPPTTAEEAANMDEATSPKQP